MPTGRHRIGMPEYRRVHGRVRQPQVHRLHAQPDAMLDRNERGGVLGHGFLGQRDGLLGSGVRQRQLHGRLCARADDMHRQRCRDLHVERNVGGADRLRQSDLYRQRLQRQLRSRPDAVRGEQQPRDVHVERCLGLPGLVRYERQLRYRVDRIWPVQRRLRLRGHSLQRQRGADMFRDGHVGQPNWLHESDLRERHLRGFLRTRTDRVLRQRRGELLDWRQLGHAARLP